MVTFLKSRERQGRGIKEAEMVFAPWVIKFFGELLLAVVDAIL